MAKLALVAGMMAQEYIHNNLLFKQMHILVEGKKISWSLCLATNKHWSNAMVKKFYHSYDIVNMCHFEI